MLVDVLVPPGETGFEGEILRSKEHFYAEQEHWKKWTNFLRKHDPNKFRIRKISRPLHREGLGPVSRKSR